MAESPTNTKDSAPRLIKTSLGAWNSRSSLEWESSSRLLGLSGFQRGLGRHRLPLEQLEQSQLASELSLLEDILAAGFAVAPSESAHLPFSGGGAAELAGWLSASACWTLGIFRKNR